MEQKTEALYLINGDRFLHLRENGAGVGFATYDCATGEPLESGQISKQNLPPDGTAALHHLAKLTDVIDISVLSHVKMVVIQMFHTRRVAKLPKPRNWGCPIVLLR